MKIWRGWLSWEMERFSIWYAVCQVVGLLVLLMMLTWCVFYRGGFGWRWSDKQANVHPFMMTLGFIYIMSNSLMIYRGFKGLSKIRLKLLHASLHIISLISVIIGLIAMWDYKNYRNYANLTSIHTWIGLTTVILFIIQWCYSLLVFLYPGAAVHVRAKFLNPHVFMGITIFLLANVAAVTGLFADSIYNTTRSEEVYANILGLFLLLFAGLVTYIITKADFKRLDYHI